jgi:hypothetical protein
LSKSNLQLVPSLRKEADYFREVFRRELFAALE